MNILIHRSDAIGDTVLTLPMAQMIKERFPEAKIYFLIDAKTRDLFLHNPAIADTIILPRKRNFIFRFLYLQRKFQELRIDHYLHVGGGHLPSLVAFTLNVSFRGGLKSKWPAWVLLNRGLRQRRSQVEMHESLYNLQLLSSLGIEYKESMKERFRPRLYLQREELGKSEQSLRETFTANNLLWKDEYLVVHPGMTGHTLNWPARYYARFILELEHLYPQRFTFIISFTSGKTDLESVKGLRAEMGEWRQQENLLRRICFLDGSMEGLRNYMGILARAKLFIGPSTGTTHLANTLDVPLIGIYSPIKVQSRMRWGPYHAPSAENVDPAAPPVKVRIMVPDVVCGENFQCAGKECPYFECMSKVEVSKVVKQAKQMIDSDDNFKKGDRT